MIELMQSDEGYEEFEPNVDLSLPREVKRSHRKDSRRWLPRLIAERARLYSQHKHHVNPTEIDAWISWLGILFAFLTTMMVVAVAALHAVGTTDWLFSSHENEASIGGLMWLIVVPPLLCIPSLLCCLLLLFRRQRRRDRQRGSSLFVQLLKYFTVPGMLLAMLQFWAALRGTGESLGLRAIQRFAKDKAHIVTTMFLAASNAFMLCLSIAALMAVFHFLLFHEVKYSWRSSLLTADAKVAAVQSIAKCVPWVSAPGEGAVQWAFGQGGAGNDTAVQETYRAAWSNFVVRSMAVLTIIPRLLIAALSLILLRRSWRELMPDANDPEIDQIVDNILQENVTSSTVTTMPEAHEQPAAPEPIRPPTPPTTPPPASSTTSPSHAKALSATTDARRQTHLVAYGLAHEDRARLKELAAQTDVPLALAESAASRHACLEAVEADSAAGPVLLIVRATMVPDAAFTRFSQQLAEILQPHHGRLSLAIIGLEDHLQRVEGNVAKHRERIQRWRVALQPTVDEADVQLIKEVGKAEQQSLRQLIVKLQQGSEGGGAPSTLQMAGKHSEGLALLDQHLAAALASPAKERPTDEANTPEGETEPAIDWRAFTEDARTALIELYQQQHALFSNSRAVQVCRDKLEKLDLEFPDQLAASGRAAMAQGLAAYQHLGSLLSPRWLIPGAIAGIGIGAAAPFLAGGAPLLLTALPSILPSGALSGMVGGALAKQWWSGEVQPGPSPKSGTEDPPPFQGLELDAAVRSLLLLLLILEFQESQHDLLGRKVEQHLGPVTATALVTRGDFTEVKRQLDASLTREYEQFQQSQPSKQNQATHNKVEQTDKDFRPDTGGAAS